MNSAQLSNGHLFVDLFNTSYKIEKAAKRLSEAWMADHAGEKFIKAGSEISTPRVDEVLYIGENGRNPYKSNITPIFLKWDV